MRNKLDYGSYHFRRAETHKKWQRKKREKTELNRDTLAADVEKFLANGHHITQIPIGVTGERDMMQEQREKAAKRRAQCPRSKFLPNGTRPAQVTGY